MSDLATVVNVSDLLQSIAASIVAAVAVTVLVCLAIWGAVKYVDYGQDGREAAAVGSLAVSFIGLVATIGIIVFAVYLMVSGSG